MGIATLIRKALLNAKEFDQKVKAFQAKSDEEKAKSDPPARDLANEALVRLLNREIPARVECDFVDDIRIHQDRIFLLDRMRGAQFYEYKITE